MDVTLSHRACAHCRSQKIRCLPQEGRPDTCQRCARLGRPCVFTPLQKRKQRKRTDTRVAELEREMRAMRALLKEKNTASTVGASENVQGSQGESQPEGLWGDGFNGGADFPAQMASSVGPPETPSTGQGQVATRSHAYDEPAPSAWNARFKDFQPERRTDVVERGLLSMDTARHLVEHYKTSLYPHYPMVYIAPSYTADQLRQEKPALFLAVVAAAAGTDHPDLSAVLDKEVLQEYANRSVVRSEKSPELVQSLLISAVWYHPPTKFGELKYYEYIHMAATMALDLGIGTRPTKARRVRLPSEKAGGSTEMHPIEDFWDPDLSMSKREHCVGDDLAHLECRRTFLACYAICIGVSMSLRRPAMMRVTSYTRECLDFMDQSPDAAPGDPMFVTWVRLMVIAEDICISLSYDDPGGMSSILDRTTQLLVRAFDKRLMEWHCNVAKKDLAPSLKIMFYTIKLFLHELALHVDHDPEDFKAPYQMGFVHPAEKGEMPTRPLVESLSELISNSHALLDAFLGMEIETVRSLPIFSFVRISYAAFVLAKLCLSAASKDSKIVRIIDTSSLKAEQYMDRTVLFVRDIVYSNGCRISSIFLALLFKLRYWCAHPELIQQAEVEGADIWPEGPKKALQQLGLEGPRITEHMSSSDTSPNAAGGSGSSPSAPHSGSERQADSHGHSPQAINIPHSPRPIMFPNTSTQSDMLANTSAEDYSNVMTNELVAGMFAQPGDGNHLTSEVVQAAWQQMDPDNDMLSIWNDMTSWPDQTLTGLEDWSTFAEDGQLNWQPDSHDYGNPSVP